MSSPLTNYDGPERRREERIYTPFPARVTGVDARGHIFDLDVNIDNVSAGGFHATLPMRIENGASLVVTIRFSTGSLKRGSGACLSAHGSVVRANCHADGSCGVGVRFSHHQFL